jgi:hypothetical protein
VKEIDEVLRSLMHSFNERERKQQDVTDSALANSRTLKYALRLLFDKYQATLDAVDEHLSKKGTSVGPSPMVDELMLLGEASVKSAEGQLNEADAFEQKLTRDRLSRAEAGLQDEQERMAIVLNTFKRALYNSETELAESKKQCADMASQLQQLVRQGPRPPSDSQAAANAAALKAMQEQMLQQIKELKEAQSGHQHSSAAGTVPEVTTAISGGSGGAPMAIIDQLGSIDDESTTVLLRKEVMDAKMYVSRLESNAPAAVLERLREVEGRAASLKAKYATAEEELQSYQKYMKETVLQYKKQIQMLRSQVQALKGEKRPGVVSGGVSSSGGAKEHNKLELPSI